MPFGIIQKQVALYGVVTMSCCRLCVIRAESNEQENTVKNEDCQTFWTAIKNKKQAENKLLPDRVANILFRKGLLTMYLLSTVCLAVYDPVKVSAETFIN